MGKPNILYALLSFVMMGMVIGAVFQFVLFRRLEVSKGFLSWENDEEAAVLRLGLGIESKVRTSTSMFLTSSERKYPMIQAIEKRIAVYSMIPVENGELLQILRYQPGQFYKPHHDYFSDEVGDKTCSCGGEQKRGISVVPKKGDALLFWSQTLDGSIDPATSHGGCPVLEGEKWSATKWLRQRAFS